MIPKVAYFHWSQRGPSMSWLRTVSIASFAKFNPTWEVRVVPTLPEIEQYGLMYGQEADWTWWRLLARDGGFQVATDIVFTKPIPDEWLDADLCCCEGNGFVPIRQFAMLGAVPCHPLMVTCDNSCDEMASRKRATDYQSMGIYMLNNTIKALGGIRKMGRVATQKMADMCPIDDTNVDKYWMKTDAAGSITREAVGYHWYGGHRTSKRLEWTAGPEDDHLVVSIANEVFP